MLVICHQYSEMDACSAAWTRKRLPHLVLKGSGQSTLPANTIKVMTMNASKRWEFPVALGGKAEDLSQNDALKEPQLVYVAATRTINMSFSVFGMELLIVRLFIYS